jgi:hypothetical protein
MSDPALSMPGWVRKRNGCLVPFDAERISRALFAATESAGRPDPFLARELTDGVLHFLADENNGTIPTTAEIAEVVVKTVRELGQPDLARTFASHTERHSEPAEPRAGVFARNLTAAQDDGLITLTGLDAPDLLVGLVLREVSPAILEEARQAVGGFLVLDGPDHHIACRPPWASALREMLDQLDAGVAGTRLRVVVNLNTVQPPSHVGLLGQGPLFSGQRDSVPTHLWTSLTNVLANVLLQTERAKWCRVDWHLSERDFTDDTRERLLARVGLALAGAPLCFVFDRPRQPVALAEGIDRMHTAVLLTVGLHLPRLLVQPGVEGDPDRYVQKLGSLVRLALSAGAQKRDHLRARQRQGSPSSPLLHDPFLLDRARLLVAPVGLDHVVNAFTNRGLGSGRPAQDFGLRVIERLREVLGHDGGLVHLDCCLDGPWTASLADTSPDPCLRFAEHVAGLTPWDATTPARAQGRAAGPLHRLARHGTLSLLVPESTSPDEIVELLHGFLLHTDLVRVRLVRIPAVNARSSPSDPGGPP